MSTISLSDRHSFPKLFNWTKHYRSIAVINFCALPPHHHLHHLQMSILLVNYCIVSPCPESIVVRLILFVCRICHNWHLSTATFSYKVGGIHRKALLRAKIQPHSCPASVVLPGGWGGRIMKPHSFPASVVLLGGWGRRTKRVFLLLADKKFSIAATR